MNDVDPIYLSYIKYSDDLNSSFMLEPGIDWLRRRDCKFIHKLKLTC